MGFAARRNNLPRRALQRIGREITTAIEQQIDNRQEGLKTLPGKVLPVDEMSGFVLVPDRFDSLLAQFLFGAVLAHAGAGIERVGAGRSVDAGKAAEAAAGIVADIAGPDKP